ncbi:MAG: hypothetical protein IPK63_15575 [Candidatus Competibacteraceae bacterium]|nr:hypothetical protein [Candidatus Competibacteraceae bacterium]
MKFVLSTFIPELVEYRELIEADSLEAAGAFMLRPLDDKRNMVLTGADALRELDKPKLEVLA